MGGDKHREVFSPHLFCKGNADSVCGFRIDFIFSKTLIGVICNAIRVRRIGRKIFVHHLQCVIGGATDSRNIQSLLCLALIRIIPNKIFQSFTCFVLGSLVEITDILNQLSKSFLDRPYLRCSQTSHHLSQAVPRDLQRNAKSYPRWLDTLCHRQSRANEPYLQSDSY